MQFQEQRVGFSSLGIQTQSASFNPLVFLGHTIVNDLKQRKQKHYQAMISTCKETLPSVLPSDHVLVQVTRASICQTDRRVLAKQKKHDLSHQILCLGHEGGGQVVFAANELSGEFKPGQKVVFLPHFSCMSCFECQRGNTNLCPNMKHMGIHTPGVFSHFISQPKRCLYPLPYDFEDDLIPLIEPLACAIRGWSRLGTPSGRVAIYGAGPMGVLLMLYARRIFPNIQLDLIETNLTRTKAVNQAIGISPLERPNGLYNYSIIACSEIQAYETGIENLKSGSKLLAFSGINLQDLNSERAKVIEAIHRQEKMEVIDQSKSQIIGTSGYIRKDIALAITELSQFKKHYQQVQNATIEGLLSYSLKMKNGNIVQSKTPIIVELLRTNSNLTLTPLQASILKPLIKLESSQ